MFLSYHRNIYYIFVYTYLYILYICIIGMVKVKLLSRVQLFASSWTVAYQAPQSMDFSRQEYWSGLPFPSPGDLPNPGIQPGSPSLQADALPSEPPGKQEVLITTPYTPQTHTHTQFHCSVVLSLTL